MLPSKYDTKCYSPFLVIPPPPFFFLFIFFLFSDNIYHRQILYIFHRLRWNGERSRLSKFEQKRFREYEHVFHRVSLLYMYICDIYIFSFFFVVNFYDGYIYIYIYRNIEFLGCTFFSPARTAYRNFSSSLSTLLQHCCFQPTAPAIEWTDIVEEK